MSEPPVRTARERGVFTIEFARPEKLNAFDLPMTRATLDALAAAATDASVRVVVLRGSGRAFCSGQDLGEFTSLTQSGSFSVAEHLRGGYNALVSRIRAIEKPVIASLGGVAAGVGLSIALACDLRIAADDVVFTLGFSKIGLIPDGGACTMLPLLAGFGRALELAWTSDRFGAAEAQRLGIVNRVVPAAELVEQTLAYAASFCERSPVALALTKRTFNAIALASLASGLELEATTQEEATAQPDFAEGVRAFTEKRAPIFTP